MKKQFLYIIILISIFLISSCASTASSMEFRSAKTAVRSEKNLKKGEEWGLQALEMELHSTDASVPYFLAIEIYKPQKRWSDMAKMLDEAVKRNPEQKLERPIVLEDVVISTIEEAAKVYKEEMWVNVYNGALSLYDKGKQEKAMEQFLLALNIDPSRISTYIVLAKFYQEDNKLDEAHAMLDGALGIEKINNDDKAELLLIRAEIYNQEGSVASALEYYELAYNETESIKAILSILQLYLLNENYLEAIEWGEIAMKNRMKIDRTYFKDLLYNVALAYRGAGSVYYDQGVEVITKLNNSESISTSDKKDAINNFKVAMKYWEDSRYYFLDAEAEELEGAAEMAKEIKKWNKVIESQYIPFLEGSSPDTN